MADTGPRGPQGPAGTSIDLPVAIANGGTGATTAQGAAANLRVEALGFRENIPEGADLNDYTAIGSYACSTAATIATLGNCPTEESFILTVGYATGSGSYISQTIRLSISGTMFYRYHYTADNTWGAWYKFEGVQV